MSLNSYLSTGRSSHTMRVSQAPISNTASVSLTPNTNLPVSVLQGGNERVEVGGGGMGGN